MSFGQRNLDRQKPEIEFPENGAPTELVVKDLIEGHGAQVVPGSRVLAHYVGVAFSTGEEFDASWNRNEGGARGGGPGAWGPAAVPGGCGPGDPRLG